MNIKLKPFTKIDLKTFFFYDVEDIEKAYRICSQLGKQAKNINAGGNEVEQAVNSFLTKRLPTKYFVTNGHITDSHALVSSQMDILIVDNIENPILYKTKNETNFVLYESVYAIGEIKSSWYDKKIFSDFCTTIERIGTNLKRKQTDNRDIGNGIFTEKPNSRLPYKNPMFSFLFFVDSTKFDTKDVKKYFDNVENPYLPNMICLLDKGVILNIDKKLYDTTQQIKVNLYPHLQEKTENTNEWVLIAFEDDKASTLAYFYTILLAHLNDCLLSPPNLLDYSNNLFSSSFTINTLK